MSHSHVYATISRSCSYCIDTEEKVIGRKDSQNLDDEWSNRYGIRCELSYARMSNDFHRCYSDDSISNGDRENR